MHSVATTSFVLLEAVRMNLKLVSVKENESHHILVMTSFLSLYQELIQCGVIICYSDKVLIRGRTCKKQQINCKHAIAGSLIHIANPSM